MLGLDHFEIGALTLGPVRGDADALARNNVMAEIFEEMRELRVAGGGRDGAVKGKILVNGTLAASDRKVDRGKCGGNFAPRRPSSARRCEPGGFDLDALPQFHDVECFGDRRQSAQGKSKRPPAGVFRNKRPHALPGRHQPLGPQRRHRLAHDGPADSHRRHHLLLGWQPGAGREFAPQDLASDAFGDLMGQFSRGTDPLQQRGLVGAIGQRYGRLVII